MDAPAGGPHVLRDRRTLPRRQDGSKKITDKVLQGGVGEWGQIPMAPHPQHTAKEARAMVDTILFLNQLKK